MSTEPQPQPGPPAEVPHCYRHPARETHVRCTRCDRYICPDCMRVAAVGHQCVECVRAGNSTVRQGRTVVGGRMVTGPTATYALIAINVLAYIVEVADKSLVTRFEMWGQAYDQNNQVFPGIGVAAGEWYRLITGAFLHSPPGGGLGIGHIIFNMWALLVVGPQLERVLGRARFVALYLLAALGGNVLLYLVDPGQPAVGASGAIFGLFGAFFVVARKHKGDVRGIVVILAINLIITFAVPGISWQGHVGGLVTGAVLSAVYVYAPRGKQTAFAVGAGTLLLAVLVALVAIKTGQLTSGL